MTNWLRELRRHPARVVWSGLVFFILWLARVFEEGEVFEGARNWLAARFDTATRFLHFIAAHWWWIPWAFVPVTVMAVLLWAAVDADKENRRKLVPIETTTERALRAAVTKWLSHRFADFGIEKAFLFGSVMHDHYATSDVDVVVVYREMTERQLAKTGRDLKTKVASEFERTFGHALHLTLIAAQEAVLLEKFLRDAGRHQPVKMNGASNASY
jgi:predicted nucleotidyltransferase